MTDASQDKPDLRNGIPEDDLADGMMLVGQVGDEAVLLARKGDGGICHRRHLHPLRRAARRRPDGRRTRCAALGIMPASACAPARRSRSGVERHLMLARRTPRRPHLRARQDVGSGRPMPAKPRPTAGPPGHMVIVGGGAAGYAAAEMLRREGYGGGVTIISADDAPPYDRPNLSKDYLAGTAPEEWIPLRPRRILCGERDRATARHDCDGDRPCGAPRRARRRRDAGFRQIAARHRRRTDPAAGARRRVAARADAALARR